MIKTVRVIDDKHTELTLDFNDEGFALTGTTVVNGDADSYAPFFEADLRNNNRDLFPQPVIELGGEMI